MSNVTTPIEPADDKGQLLDCIVFSLRANDYITSAATTASHSASFGAGVYPVGDTFIFAGETFTTVATGSATLANDVEEAPDAATFVDNIIATVAAHPVLADRLTLTDFGAVLLVEGAEPGEVENFTFDYSGLTITVTPISTINGIDAVVQDDYFIFYDLYSADNDERICPRQVMQPLLDDQQDLVDSILNLHEDQAIRCLVPCELPDLTQGPDDWPQAHHEINLRYGCRVAGVYSRMTISNDIRITNTLPAPDDAERDNFRFNGTNNGEVRFKNCLNETNLISANTHMWLLIEYNYPEFTGTGTPFIEVDWETIGGSAGTHNNTSPLVSIGTSTHILIPAGPQNLNLINPAIPGPQALKKYDIRLRSTLNEDSVEYSERVTFVVGDPCCDYQIHFCCHEGGISYMDMMCLDEFLMEVQQTEICKPGDCLSAFEERLMERNKQQVNSEGIKRILLKFKQRRMENGPERRIEAFRLSEMRWITFTANDGNTYRRTLLIDPGTFIVHKDDDMLEFQVSGYFNHTRSNK